MAHVVTTVRNAIETRLATISGMQARDRMPAMVEPPMAVVYPKSVDFDDAMGRGSDTYMWAIMVFVCRADQEEAQTLLDAYLDSASSTSVKTALEGGSPARSLGGAVSTCHVTAVSDIGVAEIGDVPYLFAEFELVSHA